LPLTKPDTGAATVLVDEHHAFRQNASRRETRECQMRECRLDASAVGSTRSVRFMGVLSPGEGCNETDDGRGLE
jgi:hypothetical protein